MADTGNSDHSVSSSRRTSQSSLNYVSNSRRGSKHHNHQRKGLEKAPNKLSDEEIKELREAFNIFDRDGSGSITSKELAIAMRSLGKHPSDEELARMMEEVDVDGNGELDFEEFCDLMSRNKKDATSYKAIEEAFKVFDKEGKGSIDRETFRHIMTTMGERLTDEEVDEMLDEADADGDGEIDYLEKDNGGGECAVSAFTVHRRVGFRPNEFTQMISQS